MVLMAETTPKIERIWDYSTLSCFLECRKKYYWQFVRHLVPKETSIHLIWGEGIHKALDAYYSNSNNMEIGINTFSANFQDREGEELKNTENAIKLLQWYAKVYANEPFQVLGKPEVGFVFPIGDILYGGRIDLPVLWEPGVWIVDHKTTSLINANYFKQFELDFQLTGYILAAEAFLGRKCEGAVVNAMEPWKELKRPTEKSKKPEQHFARCPMTRSPLVIERFKLNVQRIVRDILWCEENSEYYECERRNQCYSYNSNCPYKDLCLFGPDERFIERDYKVEKWEPFKTKEIE